MAAITVMVSHFSWFVSRPLLPQAHLAVDLFFMLSGFILAHAYDDRLARGMGLKKFAAARGRRLYPLYALGLILGAVLVPASAYIGAVPEFSRSKLILSSVSSFFFVPTIPAFSSDGSLYPLNGPAWSLLWELVANGIFAVLARNLDRRDLTIIVLSGAVLNAAVCWTYGSLEGGAYWRGGIAGATRVWFAFFAGVYIRRYGSSFPSIGTGHVVFASVMIFTLGSLLARAPEGWEWLFDLATIFLVWPMVVHLASEVTIRGKLQLVSHASGEASYAVYVLHIPLILLCSGLWTRCIRVAITQLPVTAVPVIGGIIIAVAFMANRFYDAPVRAWLTERGRRATVRNEVVQF